MIRFRSKWSVVVAVVGAALVVFVLPAFVAYRYTAPQQRDEFIAHPWRGWGFAYAALAVPGDSQLKTSGMALRKADWLFKGTVVDPREVQLLFVPSHRPYTFVHSIGTRRVTSMALPTYRFVWQVQGVVDTVSTSSATIVALLDYHSGNVLYDVRDDLQPQQLVPAAPSPEPETSPSVSPTPSSTP